MNTLDPKLAPAAAQAAARLQERLFADPGRRAYAVVDGAAAAPLRHRLHELRPDHCCLYRGELEPDIAEVAPYLVRLDARSAFAQWLWTEGWGQSWALYVLTTAVLEPLRRHFRRFLMVRAPDERHLYLRFYDPRVWRVFLPTCNPAELAFLFGPVESFLAEAANPGAVDRFDLERGRLRISRLDAATPAEAPPGPAPRRDSPPADARTLSIRPEQMAVLEAHMRRQFEDRMVRQLLRRFPDRATPLGDAGLRSLVQAGVTKAAGYGIEAERDLGVFLGWLMQFSPAFDTSKELGWTRQTLANPRLSGPAKIKSLQRQFEVHTARGRGP